MFVILYTSPVSLTVLALLETVLEPVCSSKVVSLSFKSGTPCVIQSVAKLGKILLVGLTKLIGGKADGSHAE